MTFVGSIDLRVLWVAHILNPNDVDVLNIRYRVLVTFADCVFVKEFVVKFASSLWVLQDFLNVFSFLSVEYQSFGDNKFALFNDKYLVCNVTLSKKHVVTVDMQKLKLLTETTQVGSG